jgi:hypothetical protein
MAQSVERHSLRAGSLLGTFAPVERFPKNAKVPRAFVDGFQRNLRKTPRQPRSPKRSDARLLHRFNRGPPARTQKQNPSPAGLAKNRSLTRDWELGAAADCTAKSDAAPASLDPGCEPTERKRPARRSNKNAARTTTESSRSQDLRRGRKPWSE